MPSTIHISEIISGLSYALDLTGGVPPGHSVRSAMIAMHLADQLKLDTDTRSSLYYGALLKDAGCSTNAALMCQIFGNDDQVLKSAQRMEDWTSLAANLGYLRRFLAIGQSPWNRFKKALKLAAKADAIGKQIVEVRCQKGADIARRLGLSEEAQNAILYLDEHWDGNGNPTQARAEAIPLLARILCLAQTYDLFYHEHGQSAANAMLAERRGRWFDPELVRIMLATPDTDPLWQNLAADNAVAVITAMEPGKSALPDTQESVDAIADCFAQIIDAKSPFTFNHSRRVTHLAVSAARQCGIEGAELTDLRRAALLHDIGKLGVSNQILDFPGKPSPEQWHQIRQHPRYSYEILVRIPLFAPIADLAASHHERLDGKGYHRGLPGEQLSQAVRLLAVADMAEAMNAARPYRGEQPWDVVLGQLRADVGTAVCPVALDGLETYLSGCNYSPY